MAARVDFESASQPLIPGDCIQGLSYQARGRRPFSRGHRTARLCRDASHDEAKASRWACRLEQLCNARHRSRVHLRQVFRHALARARCLWCSRVLGSSEPSSIHNLWPQSASHKAVGPPSRWRRSICRTVRASKQLAVPGGGCVLSVVLGRRGASGDTHAHSHWGPRWMDAGLRYKCVGHCPDSYRGFTGVSARPL